MQSGVWPWQRAGGFLTRLQGLHGRSTRTTLAAARKRAPPLGRGRPEQRDHRRADGRGEMHRPRVRRDEQRQAREHGGQREQTLRRRRCRRRPAPAGSASSHLSAAARSAGEPVSTMTAPSLADGPRADLRHPEAGHSFTARPAPTCRPTSGRVGASRSRPEAAHRPRRGPPPESSGSPAEAALRRRDPRRASPVCRRRLRTPPSPGARRSPRYATSGRTATSSSSSGPPPAIPKPAHQRARRPGS